MSTRNTLCMLLAAACLASAIALAQDTPQDPPAAEASSETQDAQTPPAPEAETGEAAQETASPSESDTAANTGAEAAPVLHPAFLDLRRAGPVTGDAAAGKGKAELCAACHGADGVAIAPNFPNLAGQRIAFLYWQLVEFKRGTLPNSAMTPLVADLTEQDMRDLAAYYAAMPAPPAPAADEAAPADPAQLALGEQLYRSGNPAKGIPPCAGCHGADAGGYPDALRPDRSGHTPFAAFPALRGQQGLYLQTKLAEYQTGAMNDSSTDRVMNGVAHRLDADSIQAVSTWLSSTQH